MFKILSKRELAQGTVVENEIEAPRIAAKASRASSSSCRVNETGERIPLTMADTDPRKGHHHHHLPGGGQDHRVAQEPGR